MKRLLLVICAAAIVMAGGCATSPIPADVIGLSIYQLVHKIRCEARDAVVAQYEKDGLRAQQDAFLRISQQIKDAKKYEENALKPKIAELAARRQNLVLKAHAADAVAGELQAIVDAFNKEERSRTAQEKILLQKSDKDVGALLDRLKGLDDQLPTQIRSYNKDALQLEREKLNYTRRLHSLAVQMARHAPDLQKFAAHNLAYAMRFEIEEQNDARISSADFTWPVTMGTVTLGLVAGDKKVRKGKREVRVAASFGDLLGLDCRDAEGLYVDAPDRVQRYPIRGRIGLDEVIEQYLNVQRKTKLSQLADPSGQTYKSVLTFTTTIDGSIKPSITITRASGRRFAGNSAMAAQRQDIHEVTIVLIPPPTAQVEPEKTVNVRILNREALLEDLIEEQP